MPTTKPVLGYSPTYRVPPFEFVSADKLILCKLADISGNERTTHFIEIVENAIANFRAEAKDLEQRPTDSQIRAGLRRVAKDSKEMYDSFCHPGSNGASNQFDGISRQLITASLHYLNLPLDSVEKAKTLLAGIWMAAEHAEQSHRRQHTSRVKGGRRSDSNTKELVERILHFLNHQRPGLSKSKQNAVLGVILEFADASCSPKTVESIRRKVEQTAPKVG